MLVPLLSQLLPPCPHPPRSLSLLTFSPGTWKVMIMGLEDPLPPKPQMEALSPPVTGEPRQPVPRTKSGLRVLNSPGLQSPTFLSMPHSVHMTHWTGLGCIMMAMTWVGTICLG